MNSPVDIIVIGGGEHAQVVIDAAFSRSDLWQIAGFVDVRLSAFATDSLRVSYLGDDECSFQWATAKRFVLGIGARPGSVVRQKIVERYDRHAVCWERIIHAGASVSPSAVLGRGVVILAGAIVNCGAVIGDHCIVNTGAIVEHHVHIGSFTHVGPGAAIGGGTTVGEGSFIGLGSRVRDHVQIGNGVVVGMGAAVLGSIADGQIVAGVPARPLAAKSAALPHFASAFGRSARH